MIAKLAKCIPGNKNALAIGRFTWKNPGNALVQVSGLTITGIAETNCLAIGVTGATAGIEQRVRPDTKKNELAEKHPCSAFREMQLQVHD